MNTVKRIILTAVGGILVLAELFRFPRLLESFRGGDVPPDIGGVVSLVLSFLFATQLFRGRWLIATACFLTLFLAIEIWATLQMPISIDGTPFRYSVFLSRLPFMTVHLVSLI